MGVEAVRAELRRVNFAGRTVTLGEGVAVLAGVTLGAALTGRHRSTALALGGVGLLGLADDLLEPRQRRAGRPVAKGLRGHLGALRAGRLTTGAAKALGIPLLALVGTTLAPGPRRGPMVLLDGALVAGTANLVNLLDLRPGRALKTVVPLAAVLALAPAQDVRDASGRSLAVAALVPAVLALPLDLREHGMLGDAGANLLGAAVGMALTRRAAVPVRLLTLGGVLALTVASERVSFSAVIDRTAVLRTLDGLGRRQDGPAA